MISPIAIATSGYISHGSVSVATSGYIVDILEKIDDLHGAFTSPNKKFTNAKLKDTIYSKIIKDDNEVLDILTTLFMGKII